MLTLFGGILAYAISGTNSLALLILPWVCLIMGWTYWVNDEKFQHWGDRCVISFLMGWLRRWVLMKIPLKWHGFLAGNLCILEYKPRFVFRTYRFNPPPLRDIRPLNKKTCQVLKT
jgi:hypothetical protein